MRFDPGFPIRATTDPLGFDYGPGVFGPAVERRTLDAIRPSLRDPRATGPDVVYAIAMDVGRTRNREALHRQHLLFGAVAYAAGRIGDEPVRSQGHVHAVSASCGGSTPELYEIWQGRAVILMQESDGDDPGRCFAIAAGPGELVVVPPGWAHATISADPGSPLVFGAWCVRDYGFGYTGVRAHGGLAYFPVLDAHGALHWERNARYPVVRDLTCRGSRIYHDLGMRPGCPIYQRWEENPESVDWVPRPGQRDWTGFEP